MSFDNFLLLFVRFQSKLDWNREYLPPYYPEKRYYLFDGKSKKSIMSRFKPDIDLKKIQNERYYNTKQIILKKDKQKKEKQEQPSTVEPRPPTVYPEQLSINPEQPSTYPDFIIGMIIPESETVKTLSITSLACSIKQILVGIRKNGNNLEISRKVTENDKPQTVTKNVDLPFQVNQHTISATYYPKSSNGELVIRLFKEEFVAKFEVRGAPDSNQESVKFNMKKEYDYIFFYPEVLSAHDTIITIVVVGSTLEFRSTCSVTQSGGDTKTINSKQYVRLQKACSAGQFEVEGDKIRLFFNRIASDRVVNDYNVTIELDLKSSLGINK